MFETFLQFFPACLLFCTVAMIVIDGWSKRDILARRALAGRVLLGDRIRIVQEDGSAVCDIDMRSYFHDLPSVRRF